MKPLLPSILHRLEVQKIDGRGIILPKVIPNPTDPAIEIRVIARKTYHAEGVFNQRLLHRIDKWSKFLGIGAVILSGDDEGPLGWKGTMQLYQPCFTGTADEIILVGDDLKCLFGQLLPGPLQ